MKARELKPIFSALLPSLPGFVGHKRMLLKAPIDGVLRAIHFDPSAFDKSWFYPSTVVMPLCVPSDHISLLFGHRLNHPAKGHGWTSELPNLLPDLQAAIHEQAIPFLERADSLLGFVEVAKSFWGNPHTPKETAFALARAGQRDRAIALINDYLPRLAPPQVAWMQQIADDSRALRDLLVTDPDEAQRKLAGWEDYTLQKLGLERFR